MFIVVIRIKNKFYKFVLFKFGRDGKEVYIYLVVI